MYNSLVPPWGGGEVGRNGEGGETKGEGRDEGRDRGKVERRVGEGSPRDGIRERENERGEVSQ